MSLLDRAESRWQQVGPEVPPAALGLHRRLLTRQIRLVEEGALLPAVLPALDPAEVLGRLDGGTPALRGIDVPGVPLARVRDEMLAFLDDLAWGGAGESARKIERGLQAGAVDLPSLLAASLSRDEPAVRAQASSLGFNVQVLWMASGLVTAPLAHALQESLLGAGSEPVGDAVARWNRGACPACGSSPALAEFFFGERLLRCAYCAAGWRVDPRGCAVCGESGERFRTIPIDRTRPGRRLELCRRCGGYLKTIDVAAPTPFPLVAIEDFATGDLDRAAISHGFRRVGGM